MKRIGPFEKIGDLSAEEMGELQRQATMLLSSQMAIRSALIRRELEIAVRQQHGREPTSGHMVDLLMNCAAKMERSLDVLDEAKFLEAVVSVLCLARDLAYAEGKLKAAPEAQPS